MKAIKLMMRILVSPLMLGIFIITYLVYAIVTFINFMQFGGEVIRYTKNEAPTIKNIYDQLKAERK